MSGDRTIRIELGKDALHDLVLAALREKAKAQGVTIEGLTLELTSLGPRAIRADARLDAKMMMRAAVDVKADLVIDESLQATITEFGVTAGGALAGMLGGLLEQQAAKVRGKKIGLATLPVAGVTVADVRVAVDGGGLSIEAELAG